MDVSRNQPATQAAEHRHSLALLTLCLAVLVAQVDTAVVNLAMRPIGVYFHASIGALQWVVDSYNLVYAALLLTGGLLADLFGRRRLFVVGALVFTAASLVGALAPSIGVLVGARAIAGLGAAFLIPASLALVRVLWRDCVERGRALGIWTACNGLALAIGPTLGGLLIHQFGWRSIFAAVIPVSVAAIALSPRALPESSDPKDRQFDAPGQVLGAVALGAIAYAAIEAQKAPARALGALLLACVALIFFLRTEARRGPAALVPLEIFSSRPFSGAMAATVGMTFGMYGVLFLLPLTWQTTRGLSATAAGLALIPMALVYVVVSPASGRLSERFGGRAMMSGGVAIIGSGLLLIGITSDSQSLLPHEIGLALTGLGMGFATGPLMAAAVSSVSAARSGTASALINVARMAGATIGVAALGAVFALAHAGSEGLRWAMLLGALIQVSGAGVAWWATRASGRSVATERQSAPGQTQRTS
jgi:EmrB/QacA subfamily drug resistance transporter